jgi:hypothetical protein
MTYDCLKVRRSTRGGLRLGFAVDGSFVNSFARGTLTTLIEASISGFEVGKASST